MHKSNAEISGSWLPETELIKNYILQTSASSGCDVIIKSYNK